MTLLVKNNGIVVPGEQVAEGEYKANQGVFQSEEKFYSTLTGLLIVSGESLRIQPLQGAYAPKVGDLVIGKITDAGLTSWKVDIGGAYEAILAVSNATSRRFDPIRDDTRRIYEVGDAIRAKIISFNRTKDPSLLTRERGLGKLHDGRVIEVSPVHISRIIGRRGSMIAMVKRMTKTRILVGQNGRVWISGNTREEEILAIRAIEKIDREAHTTGLTERVSELLKNGSSDDNNDN
ncbi:MAG: RNA-binding protein [Candidatus Heimdallarchaeota archaeon]|nr:RNA-binding protein [Candidatus Heimdallarchaeota archaeon]MCK5047888.1 RNA-binding protein [Candidatus Heimdallarchaeota archaeon]